MPSFGVRKSGLEGGGSSGVEHNLAKVRVEGSNPFARSKIPVKSLVVMRKPGFAPGFSYFPSSIGNGDDDSVCIGTGRCRLGRDAAIDGVALLRAVAAAAHHGA